MAKLALDKNKKRWRVTFFDARGKRRRKFFHLRPNAQDFLRIVGDREERVKNRLGWIDAISYGDALPLYEGEYLRFKSQSHLIKTHNRLAHLKSYFKGKPICDVTHHDISDLITSRLNEGLSNKTANEDRLAIRGLFKWAIKRGFASENPVDFVDALPKLPRSIRRSYTIEEVQKLLLHACSCCRSSLTILANTGMRLGELEHLNKEDFDLERKVLFITHSEKTFVKGRQSRVVPLNDTVIEIIKKLPEGKIHNLPRTTFSDHFREIRKRAKIFDAIPHGFRHTYTSHLVESGMDLGKIQRITGHQDIKTLQKYLHSTGSDLVQFRNTVQFAVPSGCHETTFKRTNWGEMKVYGRTEKSVNLLKKFKKEETPEKSPRFRNERETGVEPATSTLARLHSTTELLPHVEQNLPKAGAAITGRRPAFRTVGLPHYECEGLFT